MHVTLSLTLASQKNGEPDYADVSRTENTRVSYPIYHIDNYEPSGMGDHPKSIVFLTCDAFGVLPPVSRLSPGQVGLTKTSLASWIKYVAFCVDEIPTGSLFSRLQPFFVAWFHFLLR